MNIEKLAERLNSDLNIVNNIESSHGVVVKIADRINRPGKKGLSDEEKELIGTLAHIDGQKIVAKTFGISQPMVSDLKNGYNGSSEGRAFDVGLKTKIDNNLDSVREKVSKVALDKLQSVLEGITDDKISSANLATLSLAAGNLSKLTHKDDNDKPIVNALLFYSPRNKEEDDYETVVA